MQKLRWLILPGLAKVQQLKLFHLVRLSRLAYVPIKRLNRCSRLALPGLSYLLLLQSS